MKRPDLTGERFGALVVIKQAESSHNQHRMWICKCDCGNKYKARGALLSDGTTTRCRECASKAGIETRNESNRIAKKLLAMAEEMRTIARGMLNGT